MALPRARRPAISISRSGIRRAVSSPTRPSPRATKARAWSAQPATTRWPVPDSAAASGGLYGHREAPGFGKATVTDVPMTVGQMAEIPIVLTVAGTQEVINVSSEAELVETSAHLPPTPSISAASTTCPSTDATTSTSRSPTRKFARQRAQHRRGSDFRPQHERAARALEPGERRWRRRDRQFD